MPLNSRIIKNYQATSGDFDGLAADTVTPGATLSMVDVKRGLRARFVVEAETDTLQIEAGWQISDDNGTTWEDVLFPWVLATGTAGDDAVVTTHFSAPEGVYSALHVRAVVRNKVATGTANDTWAISYAYERANLV
jgi:hypothetical protein